MPSRHAEGSIQRVCPPLQPKDTVSASPFYRESNQGPKGRNAPPPLLSDLGLKEGDSPLLTLGPQQALTGVLPSMILSLACVSAMSAPAPSCWSSVTPELMSLAASVD